MNDAAHAIAFTFPELLNVYGHIFRFDLGRYVIGAGAVFLVVNLVLGRWLQGRKIRPSTPPATSTSSSSTRPPAHTGWSVSPVAIHRGRPSRCCHPVSATVTSR